MTNRIRNMSGTDKPALMKILQNTPEFKPSEVAVAEEVIDSYLQDPIKSGYYVSVYEANSAIIGFICYGPTPLTDGTWDIYWMAVSREKQGQGIGHVLMDAAEREIRKAKGRLAIIETSSIPSYEKTRRFHMNQGYEIIARIPDFYTPGDDKIIMRKHLMQVP